MSCILLSLQARNASDGPSWIQEVRIDPDLCTSSESMRDRVMGILAYILDTTLNLSRSEIEALGEDGLESRFLSGRPGFLTLRAPAPGSDLSHLAIDLDRDPQGWPVGRVFFDDTPLVRIEDLRAAPNVLKPIPLEGPIFLQSINDFLFRFDNDKLDASRMDAMVSTGALLAGATEVLFRHEARLQNAVFSMDQARFVAALAYALCPEIRARMGWTGLSHIIANAIHMRMEQHISAHVLPGRSWLPQDVVKGPLFERALLESDPDLVRIGATIQEEMTGLCPKNLRPHIQHVADRLGNRALIWDTPHEKVAPLSSHDRIRFEARIDRLRRRIGEKGA